MERQFIKLKRDMWVTLFPGEIKPMLSNIKEIKIKNTFLRIRFTNYYLNIFEAFIGWRFIIARHCVKQFSMSGNIHNNALLM